MHNFLNTSLKSVAAILLVSGAYACNKLPVEEIPVTANSSEEIDKLETARTEALSQQVDVLSPTYFSKTDEALEDAKQSRAKDDDTKVILGFVATGKANLAKANEIANVSRTTLASVVQARADALAANAAKNQAEKFTKADKLLRDATEDIEGNDLKSAEKNRKELTQQYSDLELNAIKIEKLGAAKATIATAEDEGAKKDAVQTLAEAKKVLATADAFITANRHDQSGIDSQAQNATASADHLLDITRQVKIADKRNTESAVLAREKEAGKLKSEVAAGQAKTTQLNSANAESKALEAQNSKMNQVQKNDRRLESAKALFSPSEAEVYLDGDSLVIRMKTIAFPSGKSTLPANSFPVLGKVQTVINDLSASHVTVEGHTDANGSAANNMKLSDERAAAIKGYFAANGYNDSDISTVGFGDTKPLASNKTVVGRAQNRRVDVIIKTQM